MKKTVERTKSKLAERLLDYWTHEDTRRQIQTIRKKLGIPQDGYKFDESKIEEFLKKNWETVDYFKVWFFDRFNLEEKDYTQIVERLILFDAETLSPGAPKGDVFLDHAMNENGLFSLIPPVPEGGSLDDWMAQYEQYCQERQKAEINHPYRFSYYQERYPFAIFFGPNATISEIIGFLRENTEKINYLQEATGRKEPLVRKKKNRDRDNYIYQLHNEGRSHREIFDILGEPEKELKFGDSPDIGNIGKIIAEQKKRMSEF